jgi:cell division protein FtsW (lipid II flippase)
MFERKLWRNFDYILLFTVIAISILGVVIIMSATENNITGDPLHYVRRQAMFGGIGLVFIFLMLSVDYHHYARLSHYFYGFNISLLILVLFIGRQAGGAQRWIDLKFFDLQPSELAKFIIIVTLAKLLADREGEFESIYDLALPFLFVGLAHVIDLHAAGPGYVPGLPGHYLQHAFYGGSPRPATVCYHRRWSRGRHSPALAVFKTLPKNAPYCLCQP